MQTYRNEPVNTGDRGIPVLGFAGFSGSGKTTLISKLIPLLSARGIRTAVIKHDAHGLSFDGRGKDSQRFSQAGAVCSLVSGPGQTALFFQGPSSLEEALSMVGRADLILIEGYKKGGFTQIGVCRKETGKGFTDDLSRFIALAADFEVADAGIPVYNLNDTEGIAGFMIENMGSFTRSDCMGKTPSNCTGKTPSKSMGEEKKETEGMSGALVPTKDREMVQIRPEDPSADFTHFNDQGRARMVDVGDKDITKRRAVAAASVLVSRSTFERIRSGGMKKGDVLTVAQIAGVMGAKRTPDLIPMCHPIALTGIDLELGLDEEKCSVEIKAAVSCAGRTGVEMEALTAAATAALTVYDMCKAVQKDMVITDLRLLEKQAACMNPISGGIRDRQKPWRTKKERESYGLFSSSNHGQRQRLRWREDRHQRSCRRRDA